MMGRNTCVMGRACAKVRRQEGTTVGTAAESQKAIGTWSERGREV